MLFFPDHMHQLQSLSPLHCLSLVASGLPRCLTPRQLPSRGASRSEVLHSLVHPSERMLQGSCTGIPRKTHLENKIPAEKWTIPNPNFYNMHLALRVVDLCSGKTVLRSESVLKICRHGAPWLHVRAKMLGDERWGLSLNHWFDSKWSRTKRDKLNGTNGTKFAFFADFRRFCWYLLFLQKPAGNRRFSQNTAGDHRILQKAICPI